MPDFTAVGNTTNATSFANGETIAWSLSGTFTGSVVLESSPDPVAGAWTIIDTLSSETSATYKHEGAQKWYRLRCTEIGEAETITVALAEQAGQIAEVLYDASGNPRLLITDQGVEILGTATVSAGMSGAFTGSLTGSPSYFVASAQTITDDGAVGTTSFVKLNKAGGALAVTATPTAGHFLVITQIDAGTAGHTVTLAPGTYDGTNSIATFNAAGETLVLFGVSSTRFVVVENIGSVALSAP